MKRYSYRCTCGETKTTDSMQRPLCTCGAMMRRDYRADATKPLYHPTKGKS
jgi:hypothetical protein